MRLSTKSMLLPWLTPGWISWGDESVEPHRNHPHHHNNIHNYHQHHHQLLQVILQVVLQVILPVFLQVVLPVVSQDVLKVFLDLSRCILVNFKWDLFLSHLSLFLLVSQLSPNFFQSKLGINSKVVFGLKIILWRKILI